MATLFDEGRAFNSMRGPYLHSADETDLLTAMELVFKVNSGCTLTQIHSINTFQINQDQGQYSQIPQRASPAS
jgi:hypothetical protein